MLYKSRNVNDDSKDAMKEMYSIKDYLTKPIVSKLNEDENELREKIMDYILLNHKPFPIKGHSYEELIRGMASKNVLSINENDEIDSIYPVSAFETNKKVIFEDGSYAYAMCAIDAIGFHYAFHKPIIIEGKCQNCGDSIKLEVKQGKIRVLEGKEEVHVLHTDLENKESWSCSCCCIMHFFSCENHLEKWIEKNKIQDKVFSVDLETANKIAWLLFSK